MKESRKKGMSNSKRKDSFGKMIFGNNELCAQFLREYTNIEQLKHVQPEDIEDITNRFMHMFTEEREADVIKKVNIEEDEIDSFVEKIKEEDNVGGWFEHFKEIDLPAERKKMREEGREEGRAEGKKEGRREIVLDFLNEFGTIPEDIQKAVMSESRDDVLKAMVKIASRATSFSDFQEKVEKL